MSKARRAAAGKATSKTTARAQAQRQRILDAAAKCFIEKGLHAAGIADIAIAADMSVGLLYRYFKNKSAIVNAMTDQCLEDGGHLIKRLETAEDMLAASVAAFEQWCCRSDPRLNAALMLEITAESTRDKQLAAAARKKDEIVRSQLEGVIRRRASSNARPLPPAAARARAMILHLLLEGLVIRAVREPELDRSVLKSALRVALSELMQD